jgi:hypothetical protein
VHQDRQAVVEHVFLVGDIDAREILGETQSRQCSQHDKRHDSSQHFRTPKRILLRRAPAMPPDTFSEHSARFGRKGFME